MFFCIMKKSNNKLGMIVSHPFSNTQRLKCFPDGSEVKNLPVNAGIQFLGWGDPLENEMATYSSILTGKSHRRRILAGYTVHGVAKNQTQLNH